MTMIQRLLIFGLFLFSACSHAPKKTDFVARACGPTPVMAADLSRFAFTADPAKVTVVRLFRANCPFCKEDLMRIGQLFRDGSWKPQTVQLLLIGYRKEGVEDRSTFDKFVREDLPQFGIPPEAVQMVYLDKTYYALIKSKNSKGKRIFETWRAVPFGMIFGKDGRLAYRGHFTESPITQEEQYRFVTDLQNEVCQ